LFSVVASKTLDISQGSVATHLRCGEIFSDSTIRKFYLASDSEISLKIDQYLIEVRAYEKLCQFLGHPVYLRKTIDGVTSQA